MVIDHGSQQIAAHTDDAAVAPLQRSLINHAVLLDLAAVGCNALFDFERMDDIVFLDEQIEFLCVGIFEAGEVCPGLCIDIVPDKLHHNAALAVMQINVKTTSKSHLFHVISHTPYPPHLLQSLKIFLEAGDLIFPDWVEEYRADRTAIKKSVIITVCIMQSRETISCFTAYIYR